MNMKLERKVADSFISTLKMAEHAPDEQDCNVVLTLGELRQHTQWCQYAAQLADTAAASNADYTQMRRKVQRAEALEVALKVQFNRLEKLVAKANNINSLSIEMRNDINMINKQQGLIKTEMENAETNN
jgi:hypothetical protein